MIDRLETLANGSRRLPLTSQMLVDEEELMEIIDQMRIAVPDEMREAARIRQERERIIAQGREEAERMVTLAQEEAFRLIGEHRIVEEARRRAQEMVAKAENEAQVLRRGADRYALQMLEQMDQQLTALQSTIRNGLKALREKVGESEAPVEMEEKEGQEESTS